ncbi:PHD finger protein ALFIN-LIKE 3-like [Anneissia japonica]|uniref:PHD finger protein ALFIN-LIKE 3-like n=1 Tax=Anneissia japonica TaxID=1529436 RepID=UPI00142579BE|nr:PHD finger protein ALFIN-LIKE 3-like [Anneissia japonica]
MLPSWIKTPCTHGFHEFSSLTTTAEKLSKKTKVKRQRKTKMADGKSTKQQQKHLNQKEASSDEDEEWPCLVCGELFRNSRAGEKWIQCTVCQLWAHEECTPGERGYICQNCD